jgi:hypothetical protein
VRVTLAQEDVSRFLKVGFVNAGSIVSLEVTPTRADSEPDRNFRWPHLYFEPWIDERTRTGDLAAPCVNRLPAQDGDTDKSHLRVEDDGKAFFATVAGTVGVVGGPEAFGEFETRLTFRCVAPGESVAGRWELTSFVPATGNLGLVPVPRGTRSVRSSVRTTWTFYLGNASQLPQETEPGQTLEVGPAVTQVRALFGGLAAIVVFEGRT